MRPLDPGPPTRRENVLTGAVVDLPINCCSVVSTLRWAREHRPDGNNLLELCRYGPKLVVKPNQEDRKILNKLQKQR